MPCRDAQETAEDVARRSYGKLIAYLAARPRDVAAAEDALSDAFAAAASAQLSGSESSSIIAVPMVPRQRYASSHYRGPLRPTGADMTAHTPEGVSAQLADRSIVVIGKATPPRDPNDDDDDEEEEDSDAESDEEEPAVIREPDE